MATFGVQKTDIFGSFGEFSVGVDGDALRARFLLTKIRPGGQGSWENELAAHMSPWREVFKVEELTFDELVQRDLDDSRVAHDLIPYLLDSPQRARFFPPILAVLVPKKATGSGIDRLYPAVTRSTPTDEVFGDLFGFEQMSWNNEPTPLAKLSFNRQRAAFVIVDGQHRAMAILALHRQLTDSWANNAFASYYSHLRVDPEHVRNLELPVCILYFPELYSGSPRLKPGIELGPICRELFLAVNRNAKRVSASRELLLDDEDIAARLMRRTLSQLKDRGEANAELARVYSFSYGDSDDYGKEVVTGRFEYSSAVALHKLHCAAAFGRDDGLSFESFVDLSDHRQTRNPDRPATILLDTPQQNHSTVSRASGRILPAADVEAIVQYLGDHNDAIILPLFDRFRPFAIHNAAMRKLRTELSDPALRSEIHQQKCFTLLFEGSGARTVFEDHVERLTEIRNENENEGRQSNDYITNQLAFSETVLNALTRHEQSLRRRRAANLLGLHESIFSDTAAGDDGRTAEEIARTIYVAVSTQAFQLGFVLAVLTVVQQLVTSTTPYRERVGLVRFVTDVFIRGLNRYFSPGSTSAHRSLRGFAAHKRTRVFDPQSPGLRGLLAMSVPELNERQWDFFRYAILEMVHSKYAAPLLASDGTDNEEHVNAYRAAVPAIVAGVRKWRRAYIDNGIRSALKTRENQHRRMLAEAEARGAGKSAEEIAALLKGLEDEVVEVAKSAAKNHLKASLGTVPSAQVMTRIVLNTAGEGSAEDSTQAEDSSQIEEDEEEVPESE